MAKGSALRFSSPDLMPAAMRALYDRQHAKPAAGPREEKALRPRRSKYGATPTISGGIRFDSKREARTYERLVRMREAGEVRRFHRQVIFDLPGGIVYRLDFQVFFPDGRVEHWDAKGVETKEFKLKRRLVRDEYGVEILTV